MSIWSSCATIGFDRWINWAKRPTGALRDHLDEWLARPKARPK